MTDARQNGDVASAIEELAQNHDVVDVFVLAHSNRLIRSVAKLDPSSRAKIRLVYNTGCADAYQADEWIDVGADVYVGHPGRRSISPVFYVLFLRRWLAGDTVSDATNESNIRTKRKLEVVGGAASGFKFTGSELAESTRARLDGATRADHTMKWFVAAFVTHFVGMVMFYVGWRFTFGVEPRLFPEALDVVWPSVSLLVTGVVSIVCISCGVVGLSDRPVRYIGFFIGAVSLFLSSAWLFAGLATLGFF